MIYKGGVLTRALLFSQRNHAIYFFLTYVRGINMSFNERKVCKHEKDYDVGYRGDGFDLHYGNGI